MGRGGGYGWAERKRAKRGESREMKVRETG